MRYFRFPGSRLLAVLAVTGAVAGGGYAFTASNTVPGSQAGSGSGTISGYTITSVAYTLNSTTPTNLDQVAFSISPTTTATLKIQLSSGGSWYSCTNSSGSVTCGTTSPQATAAAATNLTVVAAQ